MNRILKFGWLCSAVLSLGVMGTTCWAQGAELIDAPVIEAPIIDNPNDTLVTANSLDFSNMLEGAYDGTARVTINGYPFEAHSSTSPLTFTEPLTFGFRQAAALCGVRSTTFETPVGTLTTVDEVHIEPVPALGWYFVYATMHITGGTGIFVHAEGDLGLYGQIHVAGDVSRLLSLIDGSVHFEVLPAGN
jgi:hypothetical protein